MDEASRRASKLRSLSRHVPLGMRITARHALDAAWSRRRARVFWASSVAYRLTPGGFGCYWMLRELEDPSYDHERDKDPVRRKQYEEHGWRDVAVGRLRRPGPAEAVSWKREHVLLPVMLEHFHRVVRVESEPGWKWVLLQGKA